MGIVGTWRITNIPCYFAFTIILAFVIRIILSILAGIDKRSRKAFFCTLWGFENKEFKDCGDHWQAFPLGIIELLTFPILIQTEHWQFIGAWITFKTLGHYKAWSNKRTLANRFLIGNALIVIFSVLFLVKLVDLVKIP